MGIRLSGPYMRGFVDDSCGQQQLQWDFSAISPPADIQAHVLPTLLSCRIHLQINTLKRNLNNGALLEFWRILGEFA